MATTTEAKKADTSQRSVERTVQQRENDQKAQLLTGENLRTELASPNEVLTGACPNCGWKPSVYAQMARYYRPADPDENGKPVKGEREIVELRADPASRSQYERKGFEIIDSDVQGVRARRINSAVIEEFPRHDPREPLRHTPDDPPSPELVKRVAQIAPERVADAQTMKEFAKHPPADSLADTTGTGTASERKVETTAKSTEDRSSESARTGTRADTEKVETRKAEASTTTARGGS